MRGQCASPVAAAVVLASGAGTRVGADRNKVLLPLAGRSVVSWSIRAFAATAGIGVIVLVIRECDRDVMADIVARECPGIRVELVVGGVARHDSEWNALLALADRIDAGAVDVVLLHDAARPLVTPELASAVLAAATEHGAAVPGLREDLLAADGADTVVAVTDDLITVQTPQACVAAALFAAYEAADRDGYHGTDTASCLERYSNVHVHWVPGDRSNFKITYAGDLPAAERVLAARGCVPSPGPLVERGPTA